MNDTRVIVTVSPSLPTDLRARVDAFAADLTSQGIPVDVDEVRVCISCGCTDDRACFGGCSWISDQDDLCTSCAPTTTPSRELETIPEEG